LEFPETIPNCIRTSFIKKKTKTKTKKKNCNSNAFKEVEICAMAKMTNLGDYIPITQARSRKRQLREKSDSKSYSSRCKLKYSDLRVARERRNKK